MPPESDYFFVLPRRLPPLFVRPSFVRPTRHCDHHHFSADPTLPASSDTAPYAMRPLFPNTIVAPNVKLGILTDPYCTSPRSQNVHVESRSCIKVSCSVRTIITLLFSKASRPSPIPFLSLFLSLLSESSDCTRAASTYRLSTTFSIAQPQPSSRSAISRRFVYAYPLTLYRRSLASTAIVFFV